ncbi:MAG: hypothetical protein AAFX87_10385 [Bacteroidota bacterium]
MKVSFPLITLILLCYLTGCGEKPSESKAGSTEDQVEIAAQDTVQGEIAPEEGNVVQKRPGSVYYIKSKSGLDYFDSPKGEPLGKFAFNQTVYTTVYPDMPDQVVVGEDTLNGEWLGVERESDTVYVFSGFLGSSKIFSDLALYVASPFTVYQNQEFSGFVNVSESYGWASEDDPPIIPEAKLGQDSLALSQKYKSRILAKAKISASDTVFIYNFVSDSVYVYPVNELSMAAYIDVYSKGDDDIDEYSYMVGFDLKREYKAPGMNFTYIGQENIFETGHVTPILWEPLADERFPDQFKKNITSHVRGWLQHATPNESFKFSTDGLDYYIQNLVGESGRILRYMVIVESKTGEPVYHDVMYETESLYLVSLNLKNEPDQYQYQWTGKVFKNKPAMVYGFRGNSFGCPSIKFIGTEPPIVILCDNRH